MNERPNEGAEATGSELDETASAQPPDTQGPLFLLATFVVLLGAVIVLGILTNP